MTSSNDSDLGSSILDMSSCLLGLIGSSFMILTYIFFEKLRNQYLYRSLIHLAIMDFLFSFPLFVLITTPVDIQACYILHTTSEFGVVGSFFWAVAMALTIHNLFFYNRADYQENSSRWWYLTIGYLGPAIFTAMRLLLGAPNFYSNGECAKFGVIDIDIETGEPSLPFFFIPFLVALAIEVIIYVRIWLHLRATLMGEEAGMVLRQLIWYPLILILCWGLAEVTFVVIYFEGSQLIFLQDLVTFTTRSQGIFNALIYGFSYNVRMILKDKCIKPFRRHNSYVVDDDVSLSSASSAVNLN